jgi:hypothetical protein
MATYAQGYWAGWISYLEGYGRNDHIFSVLLREARSLEEQANHGLAPHGDYWLGYHHGRAAAKTRAERCLCH